MRIGDSWMMYFWHVVLDLRLISFVDFILWSWYSIYTWFMYDVWLCGVGTRLSVLSFWIILSSWIECVTLQVFLAIRNSFPRNVLCLIVVYGSFIIFPARWEWKPHYVTTRSGGSVFLPFGFSLILPAVGCSLQKMYLYQSYHSYFLSQWLLFSGCNNAIIYSDVLYLFSHTLRHVQWMLLIGCNFILLVILMLFLCDYVSIISFCLGDIILET